MAETRRQEQAALSLSARGSAVRFRWKGDEEEIVSFSIVTTAAAPSTAEYHDRMTLVHDESQFEDWIREPPERAAAMMKPYAGTIDVWQVPADVGNVRNNRPDLMERVAAV
jgi:putative SOS response-associated peptidase YedK